MTDLSVQNALARQAPPRRALWPMSPLLMMSTVALASAAGALLGHAAPGDATAFEPNLILLLRFMAVVKFAGVVATAALVTWRLARPAPLGVAFGYVGTVATMALAPGLIWSLAHIGLAAGLFHAGLLAFLMLAYGDRDALAPFSRDV